MAELVKRHQYLKQPGQVPPKQPKFIPIALTTGTSKPRVMANKHHAVIHVGAINWDLYSEISGHYLLRVKDDTLTRQLEADELILTKFAAMRMLHVKLMSLFSMTSCTLLILMTVR